jgi:pyruvate dehydrogenase E1 component beta subunit
MQNAPVVSTTQAINQCLSQLLDNDNSVILVGEGVPDPKGCFGTTLGLKEKHSKRVYDMPVSENGMTGICIGLAISGFRPIMTHMRVDFLMYAMDQIVNNASKWRSMFGSKAGNCPLVIRAVIGRGWGQGVQHSQNLEAMFASVPGLKVICPSDGYTAKGLIVSAVYDDSPVICLEHRWTHSLLSKVPDALYKLPIGKARMLREGTSILLIAWGYMTTEAVKAADAINAVNPESCAVLDLLSISLNEIDVDLVHEYAGRVDISYIITDSPDRLIASYIAHQIDAIIVGPGAALCPPSPALSYEFYPTCNSILEVVAPDLQTVKSTLPHDVPDTNFTGPF